MVLAESSQEALEEMGWHGTFANPDASNVSPESRISTASFEPSCRKLPLYEVPEGGAGGRFMGFLPSLGSWYFQNCNPDITFSVI